MSAVPEFQINTPEALKSATELGYWRSFFEQLGTSVWVWDLDNDTMDFTPTWLRTMGYASEDIQMGEQWFSLLHPDDADTVSAQTQACINGETQNINLEFRLRRADGLYNWINSRAQIVEIGAENPSRYFFGLYTDTSKQHADTHLVREQETRWTRALEGTNTGVWEWDVDSGEAYWSPEFLRIMKIENAEIEHNIATWDTLTAPEDLVRDRRLREQYLAGEISEYRDEHRAICGDGSIIWILICGKIASRSASGEPLRMVGTIKNITDRKLEQQTLEQSYERIRRVTATIPGFLYEYHLHPDGTDSFPFASDGMEAIYGLTANSVKQDASAVIDAIHPDDRAALSKTIVESAKNGNQWRSRYRVINANGEVRWVSGIANLRKQREPDGTYVWHGAITDITDEVTNEHRLVHMAQVLPGAVYQYRRWPDGRHDIPFSTDDISSIYGVTPEQASNNADCLGEVVHPGDRARIGKLINDCAASGTGWDEEYRLVVAGEERWVRAVANFDDAANPDGSLIWFGYVNDITKLKERELFTLRQNDLVQQVTATIPGVIYQYTIHPDGSASMPFVSQGADEIFGVSMATAKADAGSIWTYVHPDDKHVLRALVAESEDIDTEYRVLLPKIGEQWRRALATCVRDSNGDVHYYAYVMDVTERKANEVALTEQATAIALSNEDLEQFNYIAAHDLKEPLRAIRHLSEWVEEDLPSDIAKPVTQNLLRLRARVDRLQALVDDLAAYSRAGRLGQQSKRLNIRDVVTQVVNDAQPLDCDIDYAAVDSVEFETVEVALATVFKNLINNAAAHHDRKKERCIKVTATLGDGFITCIVEDDGPGIPPEHHERVFKMYQQLNPDAGPSGTGSGLAIVRRIIGAAHGTIGLQSPINDRGTRFTFKWPLRWPKPVS